MEINNACIRKDQRQEKIWKRAKQAAGASEKDPKWPLGDAYLQKDGRLQGGCVGDPV
jgi:hypothetical protein